MVFLTVVLSVLLLVINNVAQGQYIYYPYAPRALYQPAMNVSFVSGSLGFFDEADGYGKEAGYNGCLGITFDRTEKYLFVGSADGKKLRKLNYYTKYAKTIALKRDTVGNCKTKNTKIVCEYVIVKILNCYLYTFLVSFFLSFCFNLFFFLRGQRIRF